MSKKQEITYLTKRLLKRQASKAVVEAAENAMEVAGYVIRVEDEWVVKEYKDGTIERLEKLDPALDQGVSRD